ncbi:MAG TPA: hypothetical protein VL128_07520 [Candidatus Eisenbacteria bacterium]|nr:hypothetical protein [Candidatus Eisenbacteria bacterium]
MNHRRQPGNRRRQQGAALLIAIFALLLISVVAIALIVSAGTDTALARNYRTSTNAYYAALAGVEEARGRLLPTNPNYIPLPGSPMPLTQVIYIINPLGGETVAPDNTSDPTTYPDTEYKQEFGVDVSTRVVTKYASVSPDPGASPALPGPSFKWVRINPVTEQSLGSGGTGVDVNGDGSVDGFTPLFYDPDNVNGFGNLVPGLIENATPPATAGQALEITSYAVLPNGGQKMLQYIVRPLVIFPSLTVPQFPAALTLAGNNVTFVGPQTVDGVPPGSPNYGFYVRGQDGCAGSSLAFPAIGFTNSGDSSKTNVLAGAIPGAYYQGPINPGPPSVPYTSPQSIQDVSTGTNQNWLTPQGLDSIVQDITYSADSVIQGPATAGSLPSGMAPGHPMTVVVNGNLDLTSWHNTGYGLLLVTGTLTYDPDASWQGVILVIGQGSFVSTMSGIGEIDGAVFIAKTRDTSGNLLSSLGASSFSQTGSGGPNSNLGRGINFNSCSAQAAEGPITYKVISFKEIPLGT